MFTVKQAAERLRVSLSTIYNLVESGRLHCHRIGLGRGAVRITEDQLQAYLKSTEQRGDRDVPPEPELGPQTSAQSSDFTVLDAERLRAAWQDRH